MAEPTDKTVRLRARSDASDDADFSYMTPGERLAPPAGSAPLLSQPLFRFDTARAAFDTQNVESAYQIQLALRYRF
jgi:hypothetical protein